MFLHLTAFTTHKCEAGNAMITCPYTKSSIVGYAQGGLKQGNTMVTAQFVAVDGSSAIDLQEIKAVGEDTSDNVVVSILDKYGYTSASYSWVDWVGETPCWINDDFEEVTGVSVGPGAGLWVQASSETQSVQSAGKVGKDDVVVQLRQGNTAVGNPFPVNLDLQEILATGEDTSDNVVISFLDKYGYTTVSYSWVDWVGENPCWINDDFEEVSGITVAPGEGLWVQASSAEQGLRFSAPEL